jgi:hypothetical protein
LTNFILRRRKKADDTEHGWPNYLFGGRVRTSTLVLVIAFLAAWWVYDDHQQYLKSTIKTPPATAPQTVPPGWSPDPNYYTCTNDTCVPHSHVLQPPPTTTTTPTTPTTTPTLTPTTTTPSPPFGLPTLPPLPPLPPPFGPSPSATTSPPPSPAPVPPPTPAPAPAPALPGLPPLP